ncbi:MAG: S-adenosylmethionine decarboxylase related [Ferruginibacter sp.]|nr:S-adenosylmethionine decarboxylase related [Ferruginibacter sp.]
MGLTAFGSIYHNDNAGGFTAMVSLENIQLSVRTWPHPGKVNLDIYCASVLPASDNLASDLFDLLTGFFNGIPEQRQIIYR